MILFGCLLALGLAVAPRIILVLAWIFSDRWVAVWQDAFLIPLLGIIFLPYTTVMYMLTWTPLGVEGWEWLWIALGVLLDVINWGQAIANRRNATEYAAIVYRGSEEEL
jgi:hypothetical protein